jgi:hypothetical protein
LIDHSCMLVFFYDDELPCPTMPFTRQTTQISLIFISHQELIFHIFCDSFDFSSSFWNHYIVYQTVSLAQWYFSLYNHHTLYRDSQPTNYTNTSKFLQSKTDTSEASGKDSRTSKCSNRRWSTTPSLQAKYLHNELRKHYREKPKLPLMPQGCPNKRLVALVNHHCPTFFDQLPAFVNNESTNRTPWPTPTHLIAKCHPPTYSHRHKHLQHSWTDMRRPCIRNFSTLYHIA